MHSSRVYDDKSINSYEAFLERIWADEDFKKGFIADPKLVLADAGVKVSDSLVKVEVHEDGPNLRNYVLPRKEQLEKYNMEGQNSNANVIKTIACHLCRTLKQSVGY